MVRPAAGAGDHRLLPEAVVLHLLTNDAPGDADILCTHSDLRTQSLKLSAQPTGENDDGGQASTCRADENQACQLRPCRNSHATAGVLAPRGDLTMRGRCAGAQGFCRFFAGCDDTVTHTTELGCMLAPSSQHKMRRRSRRRRTTCWPASSSLAMTLASRPSMWARQSMTTTCLNNTYLGFIWRLHVIFYFIFTSNRRWKKNRIMAACDDNVNIPRERLRRALLNPIAAPG